MPLSWPARFYLWGVGVAGGSALLCWLLAWPAPAPLALGGGVPAGAPVGDAPASLALESALLLLAVIAQHVPLALGPRRKRNLTIGVYFAALLLFGAPVAVALAGGAHLLGQSLLALRRDAAGKRLATRRGVLFNTGQMMLSTAVGGAAYYALAPRVAPALLERPESLWALPLAAGAMYLTNSLTVAGMAGLQLGQSPLRIWRSGLRVGLLPSAAPFLAGLAVALTVTHYPWGLGAVVLLIAAVHQALRQAQRLLEAERSARAQAEAAVRARGEFLLVAAHELRTPLTGLRGYAELLRRQVGGGRPADPERTRRAAEVIDRQTERLTDLVAQLLDAARLEEGDATLDRRPANVAALAGSVVATAGARPGQDVRLDAPQPVWALADAPLLERAIGALVEHAVKHSPDGETVEVAVRQRPDGLAEVAVRDRGPAVPPDRQGRFLEPYYRADEDRHGDGTGLGLYFSHRIVAAHGGALQMESPPDGGARMVLTLPDVLASPAPAARAAVTAAVAEAPPHRGAVEDTPAAG